MSSAITDLTAIQLSQTIASKAVSCREVMQAYLERIQRLNPSVNAIVSLQDESKLLAQADQADRDLAAGRRAGFMHGFPLAVKDLAPTAGITTTLGSPIFRDFIPAADGLVVKRMKQAGAIIIGKTNVPEFGLGSQTYNTVYGATRNAWNTDWCAGGSSGGTAVALALRMMPVADGSDMGGSLRNPAAFNSIYGMRPSQGRVPKSPEFDVFFQQLGIEGPMARTVADLAQLLSIQAGYSVDSPLSLTDDPAAFASSLSSDAKGLRIGWLGDLNAHLPFEDGVLDVCQQALHRFEPLGCRVEPVIAEFNFERLWNAWLVIRNCTSGGNLAAHYADPVKRSMMKPEAVWEVESGLGRSAIDVYKASVTRTDWYRAIVQLFKTNDFLAIPSAQVFPFAVEQHWPRQVGGRTMDTYHRWMEVVILATMAGCPAISIPAGFDAKGRPMGLQLIGPPRADLAVLKLAHAYDLANPWIQDQRPRLAQ